MAFQGVSRPLDPTVGQQIAHRSRIWPRELRSKKRFFKKRKKAGIFRVVTREVLVTHGGVRGAKPPGSAGGPGGAAPRAPRGVWGAAAPPEDADSGSVFLVKHFFFPSPSDACGDDFKNRPSI